MKKLILLLFPLFALAQNPTSFPYGIKNTAAASNSTPTYFVTQETDGVHKKTPAATVEKTANKQNSLAVDGTGVKYPTVDAVNADVVKLTGTQTINGDKTIVNSFNFTPIAGGSPTISIGSAGLLNGEYLWGVSYYTAEGKETGIGNKTAVYTLTNQRANIILPISSDSRVIGRRLYRTNPPLGDYNAMGLVVDIPDNTTTTYEDNVPDGSLGSAAKWYNSTGGELLIDGQKVFSLYGQALSIGLGTSPNRTGYANSIVGNGAGANLTTGYRNTLTSMYAGASLTTGYENTATGVHSINYNTTGKSNSAYGYLSFFSNTSGNNNTAIGAYSLSDNLTGSGNVGLGYFSGQHELGNNTFYVNNSSYADNATERTKSLFYGNFNTSTSSQNLRINGKVGINTTPDGYYDFKVGGDSGTGLATNWVAGNSVFSNGFIDDSNAFAFKYGAGHDTTMFYTGDGYIKMNVGIQNLLGSKMYFYDPSNGTNTNMYQSGYLNFIIDSENVNFTKNLILNTSPTTSAGSYDILTRNSSTGVVEKITSANFVTDAIVDGVTTVAPSQNAVFDALALKASLSGEQTFTGQVNAGSFVTSGSFTTGSTGEGLKAPNNGPISFICNNPSTPGWTANTNITATFYKTTVYTVATLPTTGVSSGTYATVSDALAPAYLTTVVGGGAIVTPVFYNGTNWVCH